MAVLSEKRWGLRILQKSKRSTNYWKCQVTLTITMLHNKSNYHPLFKNMK